MEKIKQKVIDKCNELTANKDLFHHFIYLYERWQDESEYEDWNDYAKDMKEAVEIKGNIKIAMLGAIKRPFGIKFFYLGNYIKLYLKFTANKVVFASEIQKLP